MPAKTDEEASSGAKSAAAAEPAAKTPATDGQAQPAGSAAAAPRVSLDDVFLSYFNNLYRAIKKDLRETRDTAVAAVSASGPAGAGAAANSGDSTAASLRPPNLSDDLIKSLLAKLEALEKNPSVAAAGGGAAASGAAPAIAEGDLRKALEDLASRQTNLSQQVIDNVAQFVRREVQALDARLIRIEETVRTPAAALSPAPATVPARPQPAAPTFPTAEIDDDQWKEIILGEELCRDPSIADTRNRLFRGVLNEDDAAKALAGQMLLVQAASPDRLPPLMKDVGEAYYRWRPKTQGLADPFETALASYLKRRCDAGGLGNTIELVVVGDRFDIARHNASERGATITAVHGWVVLRDNGKVYTKANVSVK